VLPGVSVTVRNLDTGLTRTVITDAEGRYHAVELSLGRYEVKAELSGFGTGVRSGITLTLGREARVDFTLAVGSLAETLVVTGEAPLVDTTSSSVGAVIDGQLIQSLPLNARSFEQLATLQPGVTISRASGNQRCDADSRMVQVSIAGARPNQIQYLLDGSDVSAAPGSALGTFLGFLPNPTTGGLDLVGVAPRVQPYLDLYPLPNGRNYGDGSAEHIGLARAPSQEDMFIVKIDHVLSTRNSYFEIPSELDFIPGRSFGVGASMSVGGLSDLGNASDGLPRLNVKNTFELANHVLFTRGAHSLKSGVVVKRLHSETRDEARFYGNYSVRSLRDLLRGLANRFGTLTPGTEQPETASRKTYFAVYVQDDLRARDNLTLNLGLRYEFASRPSDRLFGDENYYHFETGGTEYLPGRDPVASKVNLAPRVGFAWDPGGSGTTSLRGGVGMFYSASQNGGEGTRFNNVRATIADVPFPFAWPIFEQRITPAPGLNLVEVLRRSPQDVESTSITRVPTSVQFNLTAQRQFAASTVASVGYVGSRGFYLPTKLQINQRIPVILDDGRKFHPVNAPYMFPNLNNHNVIPYESNSFYHALLLSLNKRLAHGFQFQAGYTFSKAIDEGSQVTNREYDNQVPGIQDAWCIPCDRGLSVFDIRHNFSVSYNWDLPLASEASGAVRRALLRGWQLNGVMILASGLPNSPISTFNQSNDGDRTSASNFRTERPDLVPGASSCYSRLGSMGIWAATRSSGRGTPTSMSRSPNGFRWDRRGICSSGWRASTCSTGRTSAPRSANCLRIRTAFLWDMPGKLLEPRRLPGRSRWV